MPKRVGPGHLVEAVEPAQRVDLVLHGLLPLHLGEEVLSDAMASGTVSGVGMTILAAQQ